MKVAVVGGGPGGLYAALLIRKALASADVTLFERNSSGATYGWGVVFSDRTLTSFREADYRTYRDITDRFVMWDAIDVRFAGEVVRCGGQGFSGIARRSLLGLLQARCSELGVETRFETDIGDTNSLSGFDLVVAADGVYSAHRNSHSGAFGTRLKDGSSRYIWFGTPRSFDSFTFIFRRSEHGLFQVHAYPFDAETSTFGAPDSTLPARRTASPTARSCSLPTWPARRCSQTRLSGSVSSPSGTSGGTTET
jgi:anthraniloyl-CoA monooxygenase